MLIQCKCFYLSIRFEPVDLFTTMSFYLLRHVVTWQVALGAGFNLPSTEPMACVENLSLLDHSDIVDFNI